MSTFGRLRLEATYVTLASLNLLGYLQLSSTSQAGSIHVRVRRDANEQVRKQTRNEVTYQLV